jgi:hypothetical protein
LLTEHVGDELVIFDSETNEAHALKPLAAAVFEAADGRTSIVDLAASSGAKLGRKVEISDLEAALTELESVGLLSAARVSDGVSRRRLLEVGGVAAAGVLVSSALVPAYAAASTTACLPTTGGTLCQISQFGVIVKDASGNYYAYTGTVTGSGTGSTVSSPTCVTSVSLGGVSQCHCFHNNSSPYGYTLSACPTSPAVISFNSGASGIAVEVASGYTLVGWFAHQGTCCYGLETSCSGKTGCVQITDVCTVIAQSCNPCV